MMSQQHHKQIRPFMDKATFDHVSAVLWGSHTLEYHTNYINTRTRWIDSDIREEALYFADLARRLRIGAPQISSIPGYHHPSIFRDEYYHQSIYRQGYPGCWPLGDLPAVSPAADPYGRMTYPGWPPHANRPVDVSLGGFPRQPEKHSFTQGPEMPNHPQGAPRAPIYRRPSMDFVPGVPHPFVPPVFQNAAKNDFGPAPPPFVLWGTNGPAYQHTTCANKSGYSYTGYLGYGGKYPFNALATGELPDEEFVAPSTATCFTGEHQYANFAEVREKSTGMAGSSEALSAPDVKSLSIPLTSGQASRFHAEVPLHPKVQVPTVAREGSYSRTTTVEDHPEDSSDEGYVKLYTSSTVEETNKEAGFDESMKDWFWFGEQAA